VRKTLTIGLDWDDLEEAVMGLVEECVP